MIGVLAPFMPDYVSAQSLGLCSAYLLLASNFSNIVTLTILPEIATTVDIKYIFFGSGILFGLVILFLIFAI